MKKTYQYLFASLLFVAPLVLSSCHDDNDSNNQTSLASQNYAQPYLNSPMGEFTMYKLEAQKFPTFPDGVRPIYDIYIGRHGARYATSYDVVDVVRQAHEAGYLTEKGEDLYDWMEKLITLLPEGSTGQLTNKGWNQLSGIARSIYDWVPELFEGETRARVATSPIQRVIDSERSFVGRLQALDDDLDVKIDTLTELQSTSLWEYVSDYQELMASEAKKLGDYDAIASRFFKNTDDLEKLNSSPANLCGGLRLLFADIDCMDFPAPEGADQLFSNEDILFTTRANSMTEYMTIGRCPITNYAHTYEYKKSLDTILKTAAEDLKYGNPQRQLNLNFTHDFVVMNYLAILRMGLFGQETSDLAQAVSTFWCLSCVPMAANIQFMVCERESDRSLLVYPLFNGRSIKMPLNEAAPGAYYWRDFINSYNEMK